MWDNFISGLYRYGIGAIIAGVLIWILYRVLSNFMNSFKEDRDNYMLIINKQNETQNNHIEHLDKAIQTQSQLISSQGERFTAGVDKICHSLDAQTQILKSHIKNNSKD